MRIGAERGQVVDVQLCWLSWLTFSTERGERDPSSTFLEPPALPLKPLKRHTTRPKFELENKKE